MRLRKQSTNKHQACVRTVSVGWGWSYSNDKCEQLWIRIASREEHTGEALLKHEAQCRCVVPEKERPRIHTSRPFLSKTHLDTSVNEETDANKKQDSNDSTQDNANERWCCQARQGCCFRLSTLKRSLVVPRASTVGMTAALVLACVDCAETWTLMMNDHLFDLNTWARHYSSVRKLQATMASM